MPAPKTAQSFQFGLRSVLLTTTVICVTAAAWRAVGWSAVFVPLTVLMITIACSGSDARERRRRTRLGVVVGSAPLAHAFVRHEVERIIAYAEEVKQRSGEYPEHLENYSWTSPSLQPYIECGLGAREEPIIYYRSVAFSEPHWYSSTSGWGYTPD